MCWKVEGETESDHSQDPDRLRKSNLLAAVLQDGRVTGSHETRSNGMYKTDDDNKRKALSRYAYILLQ